MFVIPNPQFEGLSPTVRLTYLGVFQTISYIESIRGRKMKGETEENAIQIDTYLTLKKNKGISRISNPFIQNSHYEKKHSVIKFSGGTFAAPESRCLFDDLILGPLRGVFHPFDLGTEIVGTCL